MLLFRAGTLLGILLFSACSHNEAVQVPPGSGDPPVIQDPKTYTLLALGDSYTVGEAVPVAESFPYQLRTRLKENGQTLAIPKVVARTGWTTGELLDGIRLEALKDTFSVVTLLIGVNNQYRSGSPDEYRKEFRELLLQAIGFAGGNKQHVFVLSIPDWGVTPYARQSGRNPATIAAQIDAFNAINQQETRMAGVSYTDITPGSREAANDPSLIAGDGLHPSGKMYGEWIKLLLPKVTVVLK